MPNAVKERPPFEKVPPSFSKNGDFAAIFAQSRQIQHILHMADQVAPSRYTILIEGESGTGKEVLATIIHQKSDRARGPFVTVDCAAMPQTLLESELFGYEKGAFTGAYETKKGLVETANHGTLFIDEISEMTLDVQSKFLRLLDRGEFRRLGNPTEFQSDLRVIAATNRSLEEVVRKGLFREDLYFRINVVNIVLPPLRQRREDIPQLAQYFLKAVERQMGISKRLGQAALAALTQYVWPGNIRELEHIIEKAALLAEGSEIRAEDLALPTEGTAPLVPNGLSIRPLAEVEKEHILHVLQRCAGNKTRAARLLGISVRNLYRKLAQYQSRPAKLAGSSANSS